MKSLHLLICATALGAIQPVIAHTVNECTDARGRKVMTDRPCENPATEQNREQQRKTQGVGVEQVRAPDVFQVRSKIRDDGKPVTEGNTGKPHDLGR